MMEQLCKWVYETTNGYIRTRFIGIGAIPDAALSALKHHRHLGVHSEMISNGVIELIECNAITNSQKKIHPGKVVTSFVYGSRKLYDYVNDNPLFCK
jgi:acyl-CoA hydrolase